MLVDKSRKKKQFADYPQLNFRVSAQDHSELSESIDAAQKIYNASRGDNELKFSRGDVAAEALRFGLQAILKERRKLRELDGDS